MSEVDLSVGLVFERCAVRLLAGNTTLSNAPLTALSSSDALLFSFMKRSGFDATCMMWGLREDSRNPCLEFTSHAHMYDEENSISWQASRTYDATPAGSAHGPSWAETHTSDLPICS